MSLLAHEDPMIRAEACDCLLYQILWNSEVNVSCFLTPTILFLICTLQAHLPNEFLRYVAYYIRRLDKGEYIVSEARYVCCTGTDCLLANTPEIGLNLYGQ